MANTDTTQVLAGAVLLLVGTAVILAVSGEFVPGVPEILGSVAAMGMAAGALLLGTSNGERPV
jgi:hypothetical protein